MDILREDFIGLNGLEVRVWAGFGITTPGIQGVVLKRSGKGIWSGIHILNNRGGVRNVNKDQRQWERLWWQLHRLEIETLPDSSSLTSYKLENQLDGHGYVVEVMNGTQYRAYMYPGFSTIDEPNHKKMMEIATTIKDAVSTSSPATYPM